MSQTTSITPAAERCATSFMFADLVEEIFPIASPLRERREERTVDRRFNPFRYVRRMYVLNQVRQCLETKGAAKPGFLGPPEEERSWYRLSWLRRAKFQSPLGGRAPDTLSASRGSARSFLLEADPSTGPSAHPREYAPQTTPDECAAGQFGARAPFRAVPDRRDGLAGVRRVLTSPSSTTTPAGTIALRRASLNG